MRADFNGTAYAPSILFPTDRQCRQPRRLSGPNAQYQTEVINALLEQLQGFYAHEPVVVIAATNNAEMVDPALRRAGRLDQTIAIPLPNVASLQRMFGDRLASHRKEGNVADDVQERHLAELAFGLTGADVISSCVEQHAGAQARLLSNRDMVAEARPTARFFRHAAPPAREMRRTQCTNPPREAQLTTRGATNDIALVTIIPAPTHARLRRHRPAEGNGLTRPRRSRQRNALAGGPPRSWYTAQITSGGRWRAQHQQRSCGRDGIAL